MVITIIVNAYTAKDKLNQNSWISVENTIQLTHLQKIQILRFFPSWT